MTVHLDHTSTSVAGVRPCGLPEADLDTIAWGFLGSEFTSLIYANWPIERRVDGYLAHLGESNLLNNGDAHNAILHRVLANIGAALRNGTLPTTTWETSRRRLPSRQKAQRLSTTRDENTVRADHDGECSGHAVRAGGPICVAARASRAAMRG